MCLIFSIGSSLSSSLIFIQINRVVGKAEALFKFVFMLPFKHSFCKVCLLVVEERQECCEIPLW